LERRDDKVVMMRIAVLGPLEVCDDGGRPVEVSGRRLRALLVRLSLDAGRVVSADRLIDDLWEDDPPAGAANALQSLVSRLRGLLGRDLVQSAGGGYRLAVEPAQLDLAVFERSVRDGRAALARGDRAAAVAALRRAADLWRGPALDDVVQAPFAVAEAARLEELRLTAAEDRIEAESVLGDPARHVPELEALRAAHPLRERVIGLLMRALCAAGRPAQALEVYEDVRGALADRLGADPSPELSALHLAILRGEPAGSQGPQTAGPTAAPAPEPPPAAAERSGNLPAQITSFVGREEEIGRLGALLAEDVAENGRVQPRLVTLTGPGGAGKTRLAVEAAAGRVGRVRDGVWFVPLAAVTDPIDVPQAVAAAVGLADPIRLTVLAKDARDAAGPLSRLADLLAGRELIVILDNCEHVIDAAAALADRLLAAAPGVRILATSREPLAITGETLCPVASLAMPPDDADAATAVGHASVQLFAERARAVRPGFRVGEDNAAAVVRICRALDGIPLAIELAAARLRALSVDQVADRLDDRFRLLSNGSRAALPRHQTLRAIVDWSWDLLGPAERRVLRRLSVFSGGATPEAAQRICAPEYGAGAGKDASTGASKDPAEPGEVVDVVAALVDKSLVLADEDGGVRYRLLETMRAYAGERLAEAGEQDALRDAHAAHFLELAERGEPQLRRAGQKEWAALFKLEQGNCNAALRHAIDSRDVPTALRYIRALTWFWLISNYESEGSSWAVEVADLAGPAAPAGLEEAHAVCHLLAAIASATHDHKPQLELIGRDLAEAAESLQDATHPLLALARPLSLLLKQDEAGARTELDRLEQHPDPWIQAMRHTLTGMLDVTGSRPDPGEARLLEGYARFKELGERFGVVLTLTFLTEVALSRGRFDQAVRLAAEARESTAGFGGEAQAMLLVLLGRAHTWAGQVELGRREMEEGVRDGLRSGEFGDAVGGMAELAALALRLGDREQARLWLDRGAQTAAEHGGRPDLGLGPATLYARRGYLAMLDGDLELAEDYYAQAFEKMREGTFMLFTAVGIGEIALGLAALAVRRGQHERAAELLGCAHSVYGVEYQASYSAGPARASALAALGSEAFEAAYLRGRRRPRERVLALEARPAAETSAL
jgi:predicted ATPase/DNA-binding SARP family transcriptional activator